MFLLVINIAGTAAFADNWCTVGGLKEKDGLGGDLCLSAIVSTVIGGGTLARVILDVPVFVVDCLMSLYCRRFSAIITYFATSAKISRQIKTACCGLML